MALDIAALTLLAFPQHWDADAGALRLRFLCVPSGGPLAPLAAGLPSFAAAALSFEAHLIDGLVNVPRAAEVAAKLPLVLDRPALQKAALFDELARQLTIDPAAAPADIGEPRFRKAATQSYRALTGGRELSRHLAEADDFECALHESHDSQPAAPLVLPPALRWGQVLALAMRQPLLAGALGLMGEAVIVPTPGLLARGGWLLVTLAPSSRSST
jgi:hypothetical protein